MSLCGIMQLRDGFAWHCVTRLASIEFYLSTDIQIGSSLSSCVSHCLSLPLSFAEMPWRYVPVSRVLRLRTEFSIEQSLHVPIVPRLYGSIKFPRDPMWLRKSGIWHSSVRPAVNGCYVINVRRSLVITRSLIVQIHAIFDPTPRWNIGRILSASIIIESFIICVYFYIFFINFLCVRVDEKVSRKQHNLFNIIGNNRDRY